jgi:hypothetical protein
VPLTIWAYKAAEVKRIAAASAKERNGVDKTIS